MIFILNRILLLHIGILVVEGKPRYSFAQYNGEKDGILERMERQEARTRSDCQVFDAPNKECALQLHCYSTE